MRKPRRNHQIPMGKDLKTKGKPSDPYGERLEKFIVNHQIPMRERGNYAKTIRFLWEQI